MRRLAIRPGGIGDSILGFPALDHLRPDAVWARVEVLPLLPYETLSIEASGIGMLGITAPSPALIERLRSFDEIVTWYGSARPDFREALNTIHPQVTYLAALPDAGHAADFFAGQVGAPLPAVPRINLKPVRSRLIYIHPFSGSARKNWGLENYQMLARWLEASGRPVRFVVAPHQLLPGALVVENLAELGAMLGGSALYIGNDSGITHLAAACGAKTVAIFLGSDAAMWGPRGACILHDPNPEQVLDAALTQTGFLKDDA